MIEKCKTLENELGEQIRAYIDEKKQEMIDLNQAAIERAKL